MKVKNILHRQSNQHEYLGELIGSHSSQSIIESENQCYTSEKVPTREIWLYTISQKKNLHLKHSNVCLVWRFACEHCSCWITPAAFFRNILSISWALGQGSRAIVSSFESISDWTWVSIRVSSASKFKSMHRTFCMMSS